MDSPVLLELAARYPMVDRASGEAVAAVLRERFAERRDRGEWFRASPLEVRDAIGERRMVDLYRPAARPPGPGWRLAPASGDKRRREQRL